MSTDWKAGTLLGAQWALVVPGMAPIVSETKENLRQMWAKMIERVGKSAPFPEHLLRQVCIILPPWEANASR